MLVVVSPPVERGYRVRKGMKLRGRTVKTIDFASSTAVAPQWLAIDSTLVVKGL